MESRTFLHLDLNLLFSRLCDAAQGKSCLFSLLGDIQQLFSFTTCSARYVSQYQRSYRHQNHGVCVFSILTIHLNVNGMLSLYCQVGVRLQSPPGGAVLDRQLIRLLAWSCFKPELKGDESLEQQRYYSR